MLTGFNPSRGIAIIQTAAAASISSGDCSFNPSRGIAIIQTCSCEHRSMLDQRFNPSRGIAIIQTIAAGILGESAVSIPHAG
jgi:hypothetical protein